MADPTAAAAAVKRGQAVDPAAVAATCEVIDPAVAAVAAATCGRTVVDLAVATAVALLPDGTRKAALRGLSQGEFQRLLAAPAQRHDCR